jgi:hypothetical protein
MNFIQEFLSGEQIPGVNFVHNQFVRVVVGPNAGVFGSIISLEQLEPRPKYLLELESGFDAYAFQDEIENAE